jgi:type IV pilus assembly protein PilN
MIRINLLVVERERPRRRTTFEIGQKVATGSTLMPLAAILITVWWYWSLQQTSARLEANIANAQRETQRLAEVLQHVRTFEMRRAQLQTRVQLIDQLRRGQSGPVHMLDEISRSLPDRLWLTQLAQKGSGEVTIDGRTTSLTALSEFVNRLETSGYFAHPVEIVDSQVEQQGDADLVRFSVRATLPPSAAALSVTPPGAAGPS